MKIIIQNIATEYQDEGIGPAVLFLHGWQNNLHTFDSLVALLPPAYRIIRLDLPGFGKTEAPKKVWDLDDYVSFVENFIQKLKIRIDFLAGHSFGGRIVIKGSAAEKLPASKIILISSAGVTKNRAFLGLILKLLFKVGGLIAYIPPLIFWREKLRKNVYDKIGSDYLGAGVLRETFLKIIAEDLTESAKKITVPILLIWGADDAKTPLADGELLSKLIPNSVLKVVNGAGHLVHKEKSREVADLIKGFL